MRRQLVVGNWKMNGQRSDAKELIGSILDGLTEREADIAVSVPYVYLSDACEQLKNTRVMLGAQNVADKESGAYTGEISASMLKDFDCRYAIVGHSERRAYYGDTNESVAARFCQAIKHGIIPILCIGETLEERERNETFEIVEQQLSAVVNMAGISAFADAVIAYEPVWAIGTGKTATDEQAQEVHEFIRRGIAGKDAAIAENLQILYGGSVKPDNAECLFSMPDIDGGLIGGASLDAGSFLKIYQSTR
ncbi:MAG: triose-phosphate isomerase [Gammaproteobacteria bacterium]